MFLTWRLHRTAANGGSYDVSAHHVMRSTNLFFLPAASSSSRPSIRSASATVAPSSSTLALLTLSPPPCSTSCGVRFEHFRGHSQSGRHMNQHWTDCGGHTHMLMAHLRKHHALAANAGHWQRRMELAQDADAPCGTNICTARPFHIKKYLYQAPRGALAGLDASRDRHVHYRGAHHLRPRQRRRWRLLSNGLQRRGVQCGVRPWLQCLRAYEFQP